MVRYICICICLVTLLLAMISKKNYSKYKDGVNPLWWLARNMTCHTTPMVREKIRGYIRRITPLNKYSLEKETDRKITKYYYYLLMAMLGLSSLVIFHSFMPEESVDPYRIERPSSDAVQSYVDLELTDNSNNAKERFRLEVQPREYTDDEYSRALKQTRAYIDSVILGNNKSKDYITNDLVFPKRDKETGLQITWETNMLTVISSEGVVHTKDVSDPINVDITATIRDNNHKDTYTTTVRVVNDTDMTDSEKAKVEMLEIESDNRSKEEFEIPKEVGSVQISRNVETKEDREVLIFFFGFLLILMAAYYIFYRLKEKARLRDEEIEDSYYGFVNRLTIFLGAGFTLQRSLASAIKNEPCSYLRDEVEFSLNLIKSGVAESSVYADLGKKLGLEEYNRLMGLISQNLAFGNSNLIKLLETEVKTSYFLRKEDVRRKGEQASEKLLLPSALLMLLVIIIVMYPAFIGMN